MIVFSDLMIEPFVQKNDKIKFIYSEDYLWKDTIENENILFIFSDYFRSYSRSNILSILQLIDDASKSNEVSVVDDLLFATYISNVDMNSIKSKISSEDYDLTLGDYCQFPFNKQGTLKLEECINGWSRRVRYPVLKVAFVDLDCTLLPGVWEEDRIEIEKVYHSQRGYMHRRLWLVLKKLYSHGTQIIIVSKNDKKSIEEALSFIDPFFEEYVTHIDYGWTPKGERIEQLLQKLNVGAADCVFIDDNPVEVKAVSSIFPEMNNVHLTSLSDVNYVWREYLYGVSFNKQVASERNDFYSAMLKRSSELNGFTKINYSYDVQQNDAKHFERVKELSVKTNQMNFCKKQVIAEIGHKDYDVFTISVVTEFGNLGTVGYAIFNKPEGLFENFVMSCRALGFGAEEAFIEFLLGFSEQFSFLKSEKNGVAEKLINKYIQNGRVTIKNLR